MAYDDDIVAIYDDHVLVRERSEVTVKSRETFFAVTVMTTVMTTTAAQTPPITTPIATATRPGHRPVHMPCRIAERLDASPRIENVYFLYYRNNGQLDRATERVVLNHCKTLKECELASLETLAVKYEYDEQGHLLRATQNSGESLSVRYEMGKPVEYERTPSVVAEEPNGSRTIITIDSSGRPAASLEKVPGPSRLRTTARFSEAREPYISDPVVWPYSPGILFLGWSRRNATTSRSGVRELANESEAVTFDRVGRVRREVSVVDFQGRSSINREFVYDCPENPSR